jgi:F-box and leucine-rich repeat protein 2/20
MGCPLLHTVYFQGISAFNDIGLGTLAQGCPLLKKINILGCSISDIGLRHLSESCRLIESFDIRGSSDYSAECLATFCAACPKLHYLKLSSENITDLVLTIGRMNPEFKEFSVSGCEAVKDAGIVALAEGCPKLESISITDMVGLTDAGVKAFGNCSLLEFVDFSSCQRINGTGMLALGKGCPLIRSVDLACCNNLADKALIGLGKGCHKLEIIDIGATKVTDGGLIALAARCPKLRGINLDMCNHMGCEGLIALSVLCPLLQSVNLINCKCLTDEGVMAVHDNCKMLVHLGLDCSRGVSEECREMLRDGRLNIEY